jgi:hypothetical protein
MPHSARTFFKGNSTLTMTLKTDVLDITIIDNMCFNLMEEPNKC